MLSPVSNTTLLPVVLSLSIICWMVISFQSTTCSKPRTVPKRSELS